MKLSVLKKWDWEYELKWTELTQIADEFKKVIQWIITIELKSDEFDSLIIAYNKWHLQEELDYIWNNQERIRCILQN